jgi:hypothetical protein
VCPEYYLNVPWIFPPHSHYLNCNTWNNNSIALGGLINSLYSSKGPWRVLFKNL